MTEFIQGDDFNRIGGSAEEVVWNSLKTSFSGRDVLAYSRYPLFRELGQRRKEPDIILLDKELGFYVIEVKGISIDNIVGIDGGIWFMKDFYSKTITPFNQVEDYGYEFKARFDIQRELRNSINIKTLVALPKITRTEFCDKGLDKFYRNNLDNFIFKDELSKKKLFDKCCFCSNLHSSRYINDNVFNLAMSVLGHEDLHVEEQKDYVIGEKGEIANKVKETLYELDIQQEKIAKIIARGPQRIRGIAGSGKTLLLCQKAAIMGLRNSNLKIVVTFFTQSLYETIEYNLDRYLKGFSSGKVGLKDCPNIKVLHAWGNKARGGFYKSIAEANGKRALTVNDISKMRSGYTTPDISINIISKHLLESLKGNLKEIYDVVLIDEGQDLVGNDEFKYEGKQSFYYMAYRSIKPIVDEEGKMHRRIVWAYDELQSLNDTKKPSGKELFGDENIVRGLYKGGAKKSEIMKRCYRTPYDILTTAHAVGMGFFREGGMLTGYTTKKDWEDIGYTVISGDFRRNGENVILERQKENSPNPIHNVYHGSCIEFCKYHSTPRLIKDLVQSIKDNLDKDGLNKRNILIVNLEKFNKLKTELTNLLRLEKIDFYIPGTEGNNILTGNLKPDKFWSDDAITISKIERAKGNEAVMVYVIGVEEIAKNESSIAYRNKLFTAMTRAKCFLKVMAIADIEYTLYEEIEASIEANGRFEFEFIRPKNNADDNES
ncbi:MAG: DEAD/DEAH box helicase [Sarcina sp.]